MTESENIEQKTEQVVCEAPVCVFVLPINCLFISLHACRLTYEVK